MSKILKLRIVISIAIIDSMSEFVTFNKRNLQVSFRSCKIIVAIRQSFINISWNWYHSKFIKKNSNIKWQDTVPLATANKKMIHLM